jgi:hypothetical protein
MHNIGFHFSTEVVFPHRMTNNKPYPTVDVSFRNHASGYHDPSASSL